MDSFKVKRDLREGRYRLRDVFSGFEDVEALKKCISRPRFLSKIINDSYVTLTPSSEYMYIDDKDGSIMIGLDYLKSADTRYLYLDLIHELVHVKQFLEGKELFDESYSYVDRPTEIEAYKCAVEEARKIGMTDNAIAEYLYVEWITRNEHLRLLQTLGVQPDTDQA